MSSKIYGIITTIQEPTDAVKRLSERLVQIGAGLIVAGDQKGPFRYDLHNVQFLSLQDQLNSAFRLAKLLPTGHYARKNIGYLSAIAQDAECIYETDDDNAPLAQWTLREKTVKAHTVSQDGWVNVYRLFTQERIWPRGFPLDAVGASFDAPPSTAETLSCVSAPIQQGLADNSPDVDAVWRLILDRPFCFDNSPSVCLLPGSWCPFNSQSTWWWPEAYPLLYLPSFCSFRMTDIWRSFIAQRCLWELGCGVAFHAPEVVQERNAHNLMRDFADEVPGYTGNRRFVELLESLSLEKGVDSVGPNLRRCYEPLVKAEFFPEKELTLVDAWLEDLGRKSEGRSQRAEVGSRRSER